MTLNLSEKETELIQQYRVMQKANPEDEIFVFMVSGDQEKADYLQSAVSMIEEVEEFRFPGVLRTWTIKIAADEDIREQQKEAFLGIVFDAFSSRHQGVLN